MGLREQLLKAGLVSKKQVQKANAANKKLEHDAKKNKQVAEAVNAERQTEKESIEQERLEKRERDRERNLEIEAERKEKEKIYRARQLLQSNNLCDPRANSRYYFLEGTFIRSILVNDFQREMLARGKLGIVRFDSDEYEFVLVPAHTIHTIRNLIPERFTVLHSPIDDTVELESVLEQESNQSSANGER